MEKIFKKFKFTNQPINIIIKLSNNYYDIGFYSDSKYEDGTNNPTLTSSKVEGL